MATRGVRGDFGHIDQLFLCPMCSRPLFDRKARILSCHHTFCEECLETVLKEHPARTIACSTCRQITELPKGQVTDLPLNVNIDHIHQMAKTINKGIHCSKCINKGVFVAAVQKCITCKQNMCQNCRKQHDKLPGFLTHEVKQFECDVPSHDAQTCKIHKSPVCLFCMKCEVLLCTECVATDTHDSHTDDIQSVDGALSESKTVLDKYIVSIKEQLEEKSKELKYLAGVEKDIIQTADSLKLCIDRSSEVLLKVLTEKYKSKIEQYNTRLDYMKGRCLTSLKVLNDFADHPTYDVLEDKKSWVQETSERLQLMTELRNEVQIPEIKFIERFKTFTIGTLNELIPPGLLSPGDLEKLSSQMRNRNTQGPTLEKNFTNLSVDLIRDVVALDDGSALFIGESDDEILRINDKGIISSRYKPGWPVKIRSMSALDERIICPCVGEDSILELALKGQEIVFKKRVSKVHGIEADGVCVDGSGNIILFDGRNVTKLNSQYEILWQKKLGENCFRFKSFILDNAQCYLVNYYSVRKTEIWNERGQKIGTLTYVSHKHPLYVHDLAVCNRGTFVVIHWCKDTHCFDCNRVTEYAPDGSFIRHLTKPNRVSKPYRVSCDKQGHMWVTDTHEGHQSICIYKFRQH